MWIEQEAKFIENNDIKILLNPRKENGDLGDFNCHKCGKTSGAYFYSEFYQRICRGCLEDIIKEINKAILTF